MAACCMVGLDRRQQFHYSYKKLILSDCALFNYYILHNKYISTSLRIAQQTIRCNKSLLFIMVNGRNSINIKRAHYLQVPGEETGSIVKQVLQIVKENESCACFIFIFFIIIIILHSAERKCVKVTLLPDQNKARRRKCNISQRLLSLSVRLLTVGDFFFYLLFFSSSKNQGKRAYFINVGLINCSQA